MEKTSQFHEVDRRSCPDSDLLAVYIEESAARHHHLCPRQVLGIRMGLYGLQLMGFIDAQYEPRFRNERKHLLTIVEIDGCGAQLARG
jgi:formylmethanofuran dehydrogenase subunit E